jgi:hypothetical protein
MVSRPPMCTSVAYDVDRQPGAWVAANAAARERLGLALAGLMIGALAFSAFGWYAGHRWAAAISYAAFLCFVFAAHRMLDVAIPWRKGANAEVAVGLALEGLGPNYRVMHDILFGGEGNIDHLVSGPNGVFVIETKFRRYALKDLARIMRHALRLHDELGCFVTPVICAGERERVFKHKGVLVTGRNNIVETIRDHPARRAVEFERLARFADRLA